MSLASKAPPNEEFLKAQKQKLRELMLRNAALQNRKSLRATLAKRATINGGPDEGEMILDRQEVMAAKPGMLS